MKKAGALPSQWLPQSRSAGARGVFIWDTELLTQVMGLTLEKSCHSPGPFLSLAFQPYLSPYTLLYFNWKQNELLQKSIAP